MRRRYDMIAKNHRLGVPRVVGAILVLLSFVQSSSADESGLSCSSPFVKRSLVLCGSMRCEPALGTHLVGGPTDLPSGQSTYQSDVVIGGLKKKRPKAAFISSSLSKLFKAGYSHVALKATGAKDTILVSAIAISPYSAPFHLKICVLYGA